jgi:CheY-like chemotaxis protein
MTKILLVEDDIYSADYINRMFPSHRIDHVTTLGEAITYLSCENVPDIIFLDLNLSDSRGGETYQIIRELHPDIYTIVYTGLPLDCKGCPLLPANVQIAQKGDKDLFHQLNSINEMLDRIV